MADFTVNSHRFDPYKNFKFRIKWDGRYVAGITKVSPLHRRTDVIEYRNGGESNNVRTMPGLTHFDPIILERGVTHDLEFEKWANLTFNISGGLGSEMSLKNFRKDLVLEMYNEAGQLVIAYKIFRCWVSEYQALPELDANSFAIAIQKIKIENDGWERDNEVAEPAEN